jgi:adenylosuccinate synthase
VPVYETLPGWPEELGDVRNYGSLPENARRYVERIGELLGRPVSIVSVGPDREQTIFADRSAAGQTASARPHRTPANA